MCSEGCMISCSHVIVLLMQSFRQRTRNFIQWLLFSYFALGGIRTEQKKYVCATGRQLQFYKTGVQRSLQVQTGRCDIPSHFSRISCAACTRVMSTRVVDMACFVYFGCSVRSSNKPSLGHALSSFRRGQERLLVLLSASQNIMHFVAHTIVIPVSHLCNSLEWVVPSEICSHLTQLSRLRNHFFPWAVISSDAGSLPEWMQISEQTHFRRMSPQVTLFYWFFGSMSTSAVLSTCSAWFIASLHYLL